MKATIYGVMVEGSPLEISEFIKLQENKAMKEMPKSPYKPYELQKSPYPWNQPPQWVIDLNKTMSWNQG